MNYCDKGFLKGLFRKGNRPSMSVWDIEKRGGIPHERTA